LLAVVFIMTQQLKSGGSNGVDMQVAGATGAAMKRAKLERLAILQ
jgi:hypothetical protein